MKRFAHILYAIMFPFVLYVMVEIISRASFGKFAFWFANTHWSIHLANYAIYFVFVNAFQFIKRKSLFALSQIMVTAILALMAFITYQKAMLRMEPILLSDVYLIGSALSMATAYIKHFYLLAILAIIILIVLVIVVCRMFRGEKRTEKGRLPMLAVVAAIMIGIVLYLIPQTAFVRSAVKANWQEYYSLLENMRRNGVAFQFLDYSADHVLGIRPPKDFDQDAVAAIAMREMDTDGQEAVTDPNVIIILGESIVDITALDGLTLAKDPIPNTRALMAQYIGGTLTVPSYGGGTSQAEAALLTGLNIDPYISHRVDSVAWQLKKRGYCTTAIHTYWGWFYDRQKTLKEMGFDLFLPLEAMNTPIFSPYPEDALLYQHMLDTLEASPERDFIYAAGMQTHGGYQYKKMYDQPYTTGDLPQEAENEINNYIYHLTQADQQLGQFIQTLKAFDEPTVVIFFGDHYPAIPKTLEALGISSEEARVHETVYFAWANFDMPAIQKDLTLQQLSGYVFERLDLPMTLAQRLQAKLAQAPKASAEYKRIAAEMGFIQYDALYGKRSTAALSGMTFENDAYRVGYEPVIEYAYLSADNELVLRGKHIPWRIVVDFDGHTALLIAQTDGETATATLPQSILEKARKHKTARISFVDSNERARYTLPLKLESDEAI